MRWLCFLLLVLATAAGADDLVFKRNGKPLTTLKMAELLQKSGGGSELKLPDHDTGKPVTYKTLPLPELLKKVYGDNLKDNPDLLFVCKDGYASSVSSADVLRFGAMLAYAMADGSPFKSRDELGPFYLVWDTNRYPERKTEGNWPYQVVAVDLVRFEERFPKVIPPAGSSPAVQRGFAAFRHVCLSCHQINGQGGDRGPDLNWPVSVTEYIKEPFIKAIIDNPAKVRGNAQMHGLLEDYPERARTIDDLVEYLKAMAGKK